MEKDQVNDEADNSAMNLPDSVRKNHIGAPSKYTPELAEIILDRVAAGRTLASVCDNDDDAPDRRTVTRWMRLNEQFRLAVSRAREESAQWFADDMLAISNDTSQDLIEQKDGRLLSNNAAVRRADTRIGTLQWLASKYDPQRFGDRQTIEHSGSISINLGLQLDEHARFRDTFLAQAIDVTPQNVGDTTP